MSAALPKTSRKPRILVTRATEQASALMEELRKLGAEPVSVPILEIVPPDSLDELNAALARLAGFDWLILTSANAVHALTERVEQIASGRSLGNLRIAAIGPATARALEAVGLNADLIPKAAVAESLAETLVPFAKQPDGRATRFLLVRAQEGREHLPETLRAAGAEVMVAAAYKTQTPQQGIATLRECMGKKNEPPDGLTLTSSSAAKSFFALLAAAGFKLSDETAIASIGPITSATLRELEHAAHVEAPEASVHALAKATMDFLKKRQEMQSD